MNIDRAHAVVLKLNDGRKCASEVPYIKAVNGQTIFLGHVLDGALGPKGDEALFQGVRYPCNATFIEHDGTDAGAVVEQVDGDLFFDAIGAWIYTNIRNA